MSIKSKVLAAAATLTLVGGVGTAGVLSAGSASAATPSCGIACVNLFSYQFGTHASPNYVVDVLRQGEKTGQPIILFRAANFDPAQDWTGQTEHAVNGPALEIEYAPFGVDSTCGGCQGGRPPVGALHVLLVNG